MIAELVPLNASRHAPSLFHKLRGDAKPHSYHTFLNYLKHCQRSPIAYALVKDEDCLGVGGIILVHSGVGHIWMAMSDDLEDNKKTFYKLMKQLIKPLMNRNNLHRIQADISTKYPQWLNWVERYGFVNEGIMKAYGIDRTDYYRVAYIKQLDERA